MNCPSGNSKTIEESNVRVWSWLRMNAGGTPNTCKSNDKAFRGDIVAHGWVMNRNVPLGGEQPRETVANTAWDRKMKEGLYL